MAVGKFLDAENKEIATLTQQLGDLEGLLNQSKGDLALLLGSSLPPPAGTVADVASLGVSISRGDWGGAFLDVIGLVPLVGDGVKGLVKGTKIADKIDNIRKAIAHGKKGLADKVAKAKKNAQKRCKKLTDNKKKKKKNKDAAIDCGTNCGGGKKSPVKIGLQKRYIKNIESITGLKIKQKQREKIKESLRNKEYKKLTFGSKFCIRNWQYLCE